MSWLLEELAPFPDYTQNLQFGKDNMQCQLSQTRQMSSCFLEAGLGFHPVYGSATRKYKTYLLLRNVLNSKQIFCLNHCLYPVVSHRVFIKVPGLALTCGTYSRHTSLVGRDYLQFWMEQTLRNREIDVEVYRVCNSSMAQQITFRRLAPVQNPHLQVLMCFDYNHTGNFWCKREFRPSKS